MKKYIVHTREVWVQPVEIEAETAKEALERVHNAEGNAIEDRFEYSHMLDETWPVEEVKE